MICKITISSFLNSFTEGDKKDGAKILPFTKDIINIFFIELNVLEKNINIIYLIIIDFVVSQMHVKLLQA